MTVELVGGAGVSAVTLSECLWHSDPHERPYKGEPDKSEAQLRAGERAAKDGCPGLGCGAGRAARKYGLAITPGTVTIKRFGILVGGAGIEPATPAV